MSGGSPTIEEQHNEELRQDAARTRLNWRGLAHLPVDREQAALEFTLEERARRGSRPRNRRWRALAKLDAEIDRLTAQHAAQITKVSETEDAVRQAPGHDVRALADWLAAGQKGDRPASTIYERERERDAARLLAEAAAIEPDRALERRAQHIERNRERMRTDARQDVDDATKALLGQLDELRALRQALVDARSTLLWVAAFPEQAEGYGSTDMAALGLREPIERTLQTRAQIPYPGLLAALQEDVNALATVFSAEQKQQLGEPVKHTPLDTAMWDSDPAVQEWKRSEIKRIRQIAEFHPDPGEVAAEARDLRPDP